MTEVDVLSMKRSKLQKSLGQGCWAPRRKCSGVPSVGQWSSLGTSGKPPWRYLRADLERGIGNLRESKEELSPGMGTQGTEVPK